MRPFRLGDPKWVPLVGVLSGVAVLSAGYYYNLTFVQLGLIDLGTRLVGMSARSVSGVMAVFALAAFGIAAGAGWLMDRRGWSSNLRVKLRILFVVVAVQTGLTLVVTLVGTPEQYLLSPSTTVRSNSTPLLAVNATKRPSMGAACSPRPRPLAIEPPVTRSTSLESWWTTPRHAQSYGSLRVRTDYTGRNRGKEKPSIFGDPEAIEEPAMSESDTKIETLTDEDIRTIGGATPKASTRDSDGVDSTDSDGVDSTDSNGVDGTDDDAVDSTDDDGVDSTDSDDVDSTDTESRGS